jgi:hypothetical protein
MEKSKVINDMNILESSEFWDEHDFFEFDDIEEIKDVDIRLKKKKYVGIDIELYQKIKSKARKLHKTEDNLINEWLIEKVQL